MASKQIDAIVAIKLVLKSWRGFDPKTGALVIQPHAPQPPIVLFRQAQPHGSRLGAGYNFLGPFAIAVDEQNSIRREQLSQRALFLRDRRNIPKELQMLAANVRNH